MLYDRRLLLPIHGERILQQGASDGSLGSLTLILLGVGAGISSLLAGGWLWTKHEELELEEEYYKWLEIYQSPPYNMSPEDAIRAARGIVPSGKDFEFGLNAPTAIMVGGGLFLLYVGSKVVVNWLSPK